MSGWRLAGVCIAPILAALCFLKIVADSIAADAAHLESLERTEEKAWRIWRQHQQRMALQART